MRRESNHVRATTVKPIDTRSNLNFNLTLIFKNHNLNLTPEAFFQPVEILATTGNPLTHDAAGLSLFGRPLLSAGQNKG